MEHKSPKTQDQQRWQSRSRTINMWRQSQARRPAPPESPRHAIDPGQRHEPAVPLPVAKDKLGRDEVIFFANQLAVMVDTGVTLSESLDAIAEQSVELNLKAVITDLSEQVKSGVSFSAALEKYPGSFSKLFVALMRASEVSGTMGTMLNRASTYLNQERETLKRIKGAMIYPLCMLVFCTLVVVGLLIFILPRFEKIYAGKGAILPGPTRLLLGLSHGLVEYWYLVLAVLAAAGAGLVLFLRSPRGRDFLDTLRIRVPVVGRMYRKAYLARSLRTMATMVSTGVSLLEGLEITSHVARNHHYADIWDAVAQQAREGSSLSEELAKHDLVPCTVTHMIAAGERSGQLAVVMDRVAEFCEQDVKVAVKSVTSLVEPAMIIIMGLVIGGITLALLLPVFSMSKLVR